MFLSFQVADDNYNALQKFFVKFPNFTKNDFFIFGESYGGIYAPTLTLRVATGPAKINLKVRHFMHWGVCRTHFSWLIKFFCPAGVLQWGWLLLHVPVLTLEIWFQGFAVGNGITSFALNDQSLIYFGYYHGLFGEE